VNISYIQTKLRARHIKHKLLINKDYRSHNTAFFPDYLPYALMWLCHFRILKLRDRKLKVVTCFVNL